MSRLREKMRQRVQVRICLSAILKDKGLKKNDVGKLLIQHAREKQSHWLMISRYLMSCTGRDPATNACMDDIRYILNT